MSKLILSASAIAVQTSSSTVLTISVLDDQGIPVPNVKKTWISVSQLAFRTSGFVYIPLLISDFTDELNGFYSMRLKPNPKSVILNNPYSGASLIISVQKKGFVRLGTGGSGILAEGYITISTS
ncbi:MAG TPA: hypothetical protein VF487_10300 [Chitinophagaceae bacterium]